MVELYIDNQRVNSTSEPVVTFGYDAKVMRSVEAAGEPRVVSVEVSVEDGSAAIFGGSGYLHSWPKFNAAEHSGAIVAEGNTLFEGCATLSSVRREGEQRIFVVEVSDQGAEWARNAASGRFNTMPIVDEMSLNVNTIKSRWEGDHVVQFFPVHRDDYEGEMSSVELAAVRRVYSIDRYHPFLNVGDMLRAIASNVGYEIESEIMQEEHFKSLFMSGAYVSQQNSVAKDVMDFCVKKCSDESTTASSQGVVFVSPFVAVNAVGSIVDYESIEALDECYSRGAYLALDSDGIVTFTPPASVCVGFEYRIKYTTGYWIESRTKLKGLDTFYFGDGDPVQIEITNQYNDTRGEKIIRYMEYLVVVFDHSSQLGYRLIGGGGVGVVAEWSGRTTRFVVADDSDYGDLVLEVLSSNGEYVACTEDWAQYQGYIEERGNTEIDLSVRTPPKQLSPSSSWSFSPIIISGGEAGAAFTILEGTTVTPYFAAYPGSGSQIEFADVAQHDMSQGDFVEAIQHLFNLRYYSDTAARKIYIDPVEQIYDRTKVWDWSDRVVGSEPITYEDVAKGVARQRVWGYQDGDGVTNRSAWSYYSSSEYYPESPEEFPEQYDEAAISPEYGAWQRSIESYVAQDTTQNVLNPIFSPTQNNTVGIPIVGDRDDLELVGALEFSPRVVRRLGYTTVNNETMPLTAFHSSAYNSTLCFEDRDTAWGLNQYYREQIEREQRCEYVTLSLRLSSEEMVSLLSPTDQMPSVLSTFGVTLDGEWAECWIETIEEYRAGDGVARMKLLIIK